MATERQVLREFLMSLGFQVDQTGARRFTQTILGISKGATIASAAIAGVTVSAELMVQKFTRSMEAMFYASRRTKSSVENIQALEYGMRQIGINGENARSVLESVTRSIRMQPGLLGVMKSLDINPNQQGTKLLTDLVGKLSKMPHYVGAQFAEMFGIDEKTFLMMKEDLPKLLEAEEKRRRMNKEAGVDAQAAATASREYSNTIRELWERIEVLGDKIAINLLPYFQQFMTYVNASIQSVYEFVGIDTSSLGEWGQQLKDINVGFKQLIENLTTVAKSDGVSAFFWALGKVVNIVAKGILDLLGALSALASGNFGGAWQKLKDFANRNFEFVDSLQTPKGFNEAGVAAGADSAARVPGGSATSTSSGAGSTNTPRGLRNNNPGNIWKWGNAPREGGFAKFKNMNEGLSAMADNLLSYSKKGWNTAEEIATHWTATKSDWPAYIEAIKSQAGSGQLNLRDPGTMSSVMGAITKQENGYNPFGADMLKNIASGRVEKAGGKDIILSSKVDIHVNGGDATSTGRAVANEQSRVWTDMVRNTQGAVR